jgi:hypothetical protein
VIQAAVIGLNQCIRLTSGQLTVENLQWVQHQLLLVLHHKQHPYHPSILQVLKYTLKNCPRTSGSVSSFLLRGSGFEMGYFAIALQFTRYSDNPGEIAAYVKAKAFELLLSSNIAVSVQALRFLAWSLCDVSPAVIGEIFNAVIELGDAPLDEFLRILCKFPAIFSVFPLNLVIFNLTNENLSVRTLTQLRYLLSSVMSHSPMGTFNEEIVYQILQQLIQQSIFLLMIEMDQSTVTD